MATTNKTKPGFGRIFGKTQIIGILSATALGIFPLTAAFANNVCCKASGGDDAVIQTSTQDTTVSGSGNSIRQNSNQTSNNNGRSGTGGDRGIVQDQSQSANSGGHGNRVNQNVRQSNNGQQRGNSSLRPVRRPVSSSGCNNTCPRKGI